MINFFPRDIANANSWSSLCLDNIAYKTLLTISIVLLILSGFLQPVSAQGVFVDKKKDQHKLGTVELNRIKVEHQLNKSSWGECRSFALHKRNRCYRGGRTAYRCELKYDARVKLCDGDSKNILSASH